MFGMKKKEWAQKKTLGTRIFSQTRRAITIQQEGEGAERESFLAKF